MSWSLLLKLHLFSSPEENHLGFSMRGISCNTVSDLLDLPRYIPMHFLLIFGNIDADLLYGPAYKGIPLAAVVAQEYYRRTGKSIGFSSHRKEIKDHGEWGNGFGMSVSGKSCILLDDVITAGTAFRKSVEDIEKDGGTVWWLLVLLDREEVTGDAHIPPLGTERISAIMQAERDNGIKIVSTLTYTDIRSGIECWLIGDREIAISMDSYHEKYWIYS